MKQYRHETLVRVSYLFMEDTEKLQKDYPGLTSIILYVMMKVKEADGHSLRHNADLWTIKMVSECRSILLLKQIPDPVRFLVQQILLVLLGQENDKEAMRLAGFQRFGTGRKLGKAKNAARRKAAKNAEFRRTMMNTAPFIVSLESSYTLAVIKPDAYAKRHAGAIIQRILGNGLDIAGMLHAQWGIAQASRFYAAHEGKPYFHDLVEFMSSGPSITLLLEMQNSATDVDAIEFWRALMGATDPKKAAVCTIRADFGAQDPDAPMMHNATHGSDSPAAVLLEMDALASLREVSFNRACFNRGWRMRAEEVLAPKPYLGGQRSASAFDWNV